MEPPLCQQPRRDEAVAAIVAGAAQYDDAGAGVNHLGRLLGDRAAGVLHQRQRRHPGRYRKLVGASHLLGGQ